MEKFKELLKSSFELLVKKHWLNEINRSVDRYNKYKDKAAREQYVLNCVVKRKGDEYGTS